MSSTPPSPHDLADGEPGSTPGSNTKSQKRTSRACLVCRARKSKCTLDSQHGTPHPPCQRCKREGKECVIGSSNRGGRRVRKSTLLAQAQNQTSNQDVKSEATQSGSQPAWQVNNVQIPSPAFTSPTAQASMDANPYSSRATGSMTSQPQQQTAAPMTLDNPVSGLSANHNVSANDTRLPSRASSDDVPFNDLQNPSDALDILAHIASNGADREGKALWADRQARQHRLNPIDQAYHGYDLPDYYPLRSGALSPQKLGSLLDRYCAHYHPFYPLVPRASLRPANLANTIVKEPHLLTAVLVIASKDLLDEPRIYEVCSEHMQKLVSILVAGGSGDVEAVEAMLLLAEWAPYTSRRKGGQVGRGEEDREAWMHVGTALRIAYFLGLERYSFHMHDTADLQAQRKRLVWTACYISDRQISIRIGRAFWSRGPGPLTTLRKEDFPSLQPQKPGDDDYSTIFQATLELTMLFSNVHDVLYSNPSGVRSHLSGGYIKYIDDFRSAIYGWNSVYGTLTCPQHLKPVLVMSYDYLRLYTNAFAFHATIQRALPKNENGKPMFSRVFYNNVGAVGDARFIYEGLDAAKSLLTTMTNFVDSDTSLRYMPLRFYLFTVYAGVFLYRARTVGVMSPEEDASVRRLVSQTVQKLEQASVGDSHPGYRYSQLLKLLWDKVERKRKDRGSFATIVDPYRPGSLTSSQQAGHTPGSASGVLPDFASPASTEKMGDFSWTDLDAIGNFAVNGNDGMDLGDNDWWAAGFLPADNNPFGLMSGNEAWNVPL